MMQELSLAHGTLSPSFNPVTVSCPLHNFSDIHSTSYYAPTSFYSQRKTGLFRYLALWMDKSMVFGHSKKWLIPQSTLFARHILQFDQSFFCLHSVHNICIKVQNSYFYFSLIGAKPAKSIKRVTYGRNLTIFDAFPFFVNITNTEMIPTHLSW
jgi:hypothetical protein